MVKIKPISEKFVRRSIIKYLERKGWARNLREKEKTEFGVDIRVRNNKFPRYFLIETKGESTSKSARQVNEVAFVYSLGQIITRMTTGRTTRYYYGLGLPESSEKIGIRRLPWQIAKKLLLFIFSVSRNGKVRQYSWQDLKRFQG